MLKRVMVTFVMSQCSNESYKMLFVMRASMLVARMMTVIVGKVVIVAETIKSKNRTLFLVNVDPQRIVDFRVFFISAFFPSRCKAQGAIHD